MQNLENATEVRSHFAESLDLLRKAKDQEIGIEAVQKLKVGVHSMRRQLTIAEDIIWKLQRFFEENKDVEIKTESLMEDETFAREIEEAIEVLEGVLE